jgi:cellobiose transport system permease protein
MSSPQVSTSPVRPKGKRDLWHEIVKNRAVYAFISPFFILFAIFGMFPVFFSFYLAFHSWNGLGAMEFTGLDNFAYLLTDQNFWRSIYNTLVIWVISTIPMLFFALIIAFLLHSSFSKLKDFYRISYFLPNVTSIVAVAIIFGTLFGNSYGFLNYVITTIGLDPIQWLNSPFWIKVAIASMVIWRWMGYNAIIYLAGLQAIPHVLYEAARIDGANTRQMFFNITIPLLKPVILFTVMMSTIGGMQIFAEPQILIGDAGGPGGGGMTIVLYLYNQAFIKNFFGYGSTVAWGLFIIIALFSILNWKIVNRGARS